MKALLIMVHGSPRAESNEDVQKVVALVRSAGTYPIVEVGFLDVNQPDIPTAIATCASAGADTIIAFPYFLHTGKHVTGDLPRALLAAQTVHPDITFLMTDYLGLHEKLGGILLERASEV